MSNEKPQNAGLHHNPAYEIEGLPDDDRISNDSGCPDVAADNNVDDEYNSIPLQSFKDHRAQHDSAYNHITIRPAGAIATDNTYAHIPNPKATNFGTTNNLSDNFNRQHVVSETEDSTYNHLGESNAFTSVSHCNDKAHLTVKSNNDLLDDTYSHINANRNNSQNATPRADYEDSTYNHLGDIPTTSNSFPYSQGSRTGQSLDGVAKNKKDVASRYNYAIINKHPQAAKPTFHLDDAPKDFRLLEPDTETKGKPKPYDYAVVNKLSFAPETTSSPDDGPHEYYVFEPSQPKTTISK